MYQDTSTTLRITDTAQLAAEKSVTWRSPSNIALVKYWGKYGRQYPQNPSLSFTLSQSYTETTVSYTLKPDFESADSVAVDFTFEGKRNELFAGKIVKFLEGIRDILPFLPQLQFNIRSSNSFPHSSGIASSASSMSALALCLCEIEQQLFKTLQNESTFLQKASYLARLGSGSAARSVYADLAIWGTSNAIASSSNDYAIPFKGKLHEVYHNYQDTILIVSKAEKSVSSRAGHALMEGNPYAAVRYEQANNNLDKLLQVLETNDLKTFIEIVESEALTLHALMMCSHPPFILMKPNTLRIIEKIRTYRAATGTPVCFTLDAGPNVHVLYPQHVKNEVLTWINAALKPLCENEYLILDEMGNGAENRMG